MRVAGLRVGQRSKENSGDSRRVELVGYEKVIEEPWPCVRVSP